MTMRTTRLLCLLSISFATTACSRRSTPVDETVESSRKIHDPPPPAPDKTHNDAPKVPSPDLVEPSQPRPVKEIEAEREQLLLKFHNTSPQTGVQPPQAAIAAFSNQGLAIDDAKIFIRRPGCILEVEQRGRRFRKVLDGFEHCRLGEAAQGGTAQIWELGGGKARGVLVVDIKANPNDPRCTTKLKTVRLTAQGPRLSKETTSSQMCGFRGFETPFFDQLPELESAMAEVQ